MKYVFVLIAGTLVSLTPLFSQTAVTADSKSDPNLEASIFADTSAGSPDTGATVPAGTAPSQTAPSDTANSGFPSFTAGDTAKTDYLLGGTVVVSATAQTQASEYVASSDAQGKLFAKVTVPDYGSLFMSYVVYQPFFRGASENGPNAVPSYDNAQAPLYTLSEVHYSFDIAKVLFIRLGNQLIAWGPSQIWTPVDFINREKVNAFTALDTRIGKPGLRLHVPLSWGNVFAFADFSNLAPNGQYDYGDPTRKTNVGGRLDFTTGDFELGLTGYGGSETQVRGGADFSGRILGTTVYGELAAAPEYSSYGSFVQASLGFSRTLDELKRWTLRAEGFYNSRPETLVYLYEGRAYVYVALAADKFLSPDLASTLSAISNLEDQSYQVKFSENLTFPGAVPFTAEIAYSGGGSDKEFTRYTGNGAISLNLYTKLSF